jgi:asparagine synthase (glutamine-hydrolysing)
MNNFILIYSKQEIKTDILNLDNEIDKWYQQNDNHNILSVQTLKENRMDKNSLLIGVEINNCLVDYTDPDKNVFVCGDPYKMEPESDEDILDIIVNQNPKEIYGKVGGAYSWINIDLKDKNIEINTDFFGQLPIYYFNDDLVFAASTSISLLLETLPNISRNIDMDLLLEFIVTGVVSSDYYKTFFTSLNRIKGYRKLHYNIYTDKINITEISSLDDFRDQTYEFSSKKLNEDLNLVMKAVCYQKKSAYTLSGGVDSTLLAAVGASISSSPIECYTASTGYGNDLKFSKKAAEYMNAHLHEVKLDYDTKILKYIKQITKVYGAPVSIWGNTVGSPLIGEMARDVGAEIIIHGSAEDHVVGGVYGLTIYNYIHFYIKTKQWKKLIELLRFNSQRKIVSFRKVIAEILKTIFKCENTDTNFFYKLRGKDFSSFFIPQVQKRRDALRVNDICFIIPENRVKYYMLGRMQKFVSQSYFSGIASNLNVRIPFLDNRLIKYMDLDESILFSGTYSKQFARESMYGIMDNEVIYRKDNEGLRWRSTVLLKQNKESMIKEIENSPLLNKILSKKTLNSLNNKMFRKSLLLSLYSVALFDKEFKPTWE